jgi:hypothetical protein
MMPYNAPDDWGMHWSKCEECEEEIHGSDGHNCKPEEEMTSVFITIPVEFHTDVDLEQVLEAAQEAAANLSTDLSCNHNTPCTVDIEDVTVAYAKNIE